MTPRTGADGELPAEADVVVLGAGHNGLVCAAYLAAAGLEVVVLEARDIAGGNTVTEELTLPGFAHDSCSSAHVLIQSNPLIRDDELGLLSEHGLRYLLTDPAVVVPQDDGDALVMHRDLESSIEEIARWSPPDARSFRELMTEWRGGLATAHARWSSNQPLGADADAYRSVQQQSAWEVIHRRFGHPVIRSFMTWMAMATIQDPRRPGTGVLPSSLAAGRIAYGWATPVGGSGALPRALVRHLNAHGGAVACSAPVDTVEVSNGRATAVRTVDGRRVRARRAVVSSAHLAQLAGMLEGAEPPEDLRRARSTWRPGLSVFAVHAALRADLTFPTRSGPITSAAGGLGTAAGIARHLDAFYRGEPDSTDPWLLLVDQTVVDPDRAPGGATFKILTIAPYERADGRSWSDTKDEHAARLMDRIRSRVGGLEERDVLAVRAESPVDVAALNHHNLGGSCHGGQFETPGGTIPGWTSYTTGVDGLFLTGSTTHPGGSVSGRPGRNAARAVLTALGIPPSTVMGES